MSQSINKPITRKYKHIRVKTAKGRKLSSTNWLQRQLNDFYTQSARQEGYRSRASYKLLEIDQRFSILDARNVVLDLGSSPGSWSQIASKFCKEVIAIDIMPMKAVNNVQFIQSDFTKLEEKTYNHLKGKKINTILSDMSPHSCGHKSIDHIRIISLSEAVLNCAKNILQPGGIIITKIFHGDHAKLLYIKFNQCFKRVQYFKPLASRNYSSEIYLIATKFLL